MITITEYDEASGQLGFIKGFSDEETYDLNSEGVAHVMGSYSGEDYYVVDGEAVERPASPVTLSDLTLSAVPAGSTLTINGERYETEGDVELEFPMRGVYMLRVECWPYRDWQGEVEV